MYLYGAYARAWVAHLGVYADFRKTIFGKSGPKLPEVPTFILMHAITHCFQMFSNCLPLKQAVDVF